MYRVRILLSYLLLFSVTYLHVTVRDAALETSLWKISAGFWPIFYRDIGNWLAGWLAVGNWLRAAGEKKNLLKSPV